MQRIVINQSVFHIIFFNAMRHALCAMLYDLDIDIYMEV
jgi:hypothetical protein